MLKNWFLGIIIFNFLTGSSIGEQKTTYSLEEVIKQALANNAQIKIKEKEIASAQGRKLQSFALSQPELTFSWEGISSGKSLSQANERTIGIEQNLEFPLKPLLKRGVAAKELDIAYEELNRIKALLRAEVKKGYYKINFQKKNLEVLESTLGLLRQFQEATLVKYQTGQIPYFEVLRANVEVAKTQNEIIETRQELSSAKNDFNRLLGKKGAEEFEVLDQLQFIPYLKSQEETINEYLKTNRTLKIAQASQEKEKQNKKLSQLTFIPDIKLSAGLFSESGERYLPSFQVGLVLPLWWWGPKGQVKESQANLKKAQIQEEATLRMIKSEIEKSYQLVKAWEEQVFIFERNLLKEVKEELKAGINSYQYNQIDALGLLEINRTYKITQLEYYQALFNYLSAQADLEVAGETKEEEEKL